MMSKKGVAFWFLVVAAPMLACCAGRRVDVGGRLGWTQDVQVNYTDWADHNQFYVGDWLYFKFDKHRYNVLEVNKTSYDNCYDHEFIKNITRGGRDVFQLTEARPYYFLSSGGYCYNGMKLAISVNFRAPAAPAPAKNASETKASTQELLLLLPAMVAVIEALIWLLRL